VVVVSACLLLTVLLCTSCSKKEEASEPVVTVQTAPVQRGSIQQIVSSEAILFPLQQAAITPKISAPVKTFYVNRGDRVHKGQLLAVLENSDLAAAALDNQGAYEQAQATYGLETSSSLPEEWKKAELDLKTAHEALDAEQKVFDSRQELYRNGALARKDLDASAVSLAQAKAQYQIAEQHLAALQTAGKQDQLKAAKGQLTSAQGKYEGAAAQLAYSEIRSPIDGFVTDRPSYAGEMPAAGTPLITVMETATVVARAHIPLSQAALLKVGDPATINAPGDVHANAKISVISPALDPNSTTVEIWAQAPNPDGNLRAGSAATITAIARTLKDVVIVPVSAVLKTPEGGSLVMISKDNRAHQVAVETGVQQGDRIEITKGLSGGETVIVNGAYGLPDNTQVKIAAPASSPAASEKPNE
jgi:multidrug efflux pump subunit AcrA (membrane-fusion protein)